MLNQKCPLVLRDLYYYDIVSAFPTIMENQNYDFGNVDLSNKQERNVFVGKEQINNKNLSGYLNESVKDLTDFYLAYNEIKDEDVVFRQKDGFILKKRLTNNNMYIEMKLRKTIPLLFMDVNRESMIYFDSFGELFVNGVRRYYKRLDDVYKKFYNLNFYDLKTLCLQLADIKNSVVNNPDKSFFGVNVEDNQYIFILKNGKSIQTRDLDFVEDIRIDKHKYFEFYFKRFTDSIFAETFLGGKK